MITIKLTEREAQLILRVVEDVMTDIDRAPEPGFLGFENRDVTTLGHARDKLLVATP